MYTKPNMQYITILHRHTFSEPILTHSILLNAHIPSLTCEPIDNGWPLILLLFFRSCAVLSIHFADRRGAFALNLRVKLLVKQNLVHQVRLHWAGLCRWFGGAIIIACKGTKIKESQFFTFCTDFATTDTATTAGWELLGYGLRKFCHHFPKHISVKPVFSKNQAV